MTDFTKGFTLVREIAATPAELWEAWTNPDEAAGWWHPRGVSTPRASVRIDARVGGTYEYTMVNEETGHEYPTVGEYREVVPVQRLEFTWGRPQDPPEDRPVITVTLESAGEGRTRMTFDLRGYDARPGDGDVYDGWVSALEILEAALAAGGATG